MQIPRNLHSRPHQWPAAGAKSSDLTGHVPRPKGRKRFQNSAQSALLVAIFGISGATERHAGLMFANLMTLPHFSVSSAMNLPKSAGEPASTVAPRVESCALILGSARPALISRLTVPMISTGVLAGAPMPPHALAS